MNKLFFLVLISIFCFSLMQSASALSLKSVEEEARAYFGVFSEELGVAELVGGMGVSYILSAIILIGAVYLFLSILINNKGLALIISFVAGILLTLLINPENIYAIFLSYESLLLSILSVAPILIVLFTNVKLLIDYPGKVWSRLGFKMVWWIWFVYLVWFGFRGFYEGGLTGSALIIVLVELFLIFLAAIGILPKTIAKYYKKEENEAGVEAAEKAGASVSRAGKMGDKFADAIMGE